MELLICPACQEFAINPFCGVYHRDCVECGVRHVRAAPKVRKVQEQILAYYGKHLRDEILGRLKS